MSTLDSRNNSSLIVVRLNEVWLENHYILANSHYILRKGAKGLKNVTNRVKRAVFLRLLAEFTPMREIAKKLNRSTVSLYRMRTRMVRDGLLNRDFSFSLTGLKALEKDALLAQNVTRRNVTRLHNTAVVVDIARKPADWDSRRENWCIQKGGRKWLLASGMFNEIKVTDTIRVRTTPSSVIIYLGEIWAVDPVEAKNELFSLALPAILMIEKQMRVGLHKHGTFSFRTTQQEIAFVKNRLAMELCKAGFKVKIHDMQGRLRVLVDASLGFGELEAPNAIKGENDAIALKENFEDLVVYGFSLRGLHSRLEALEHSKDIPVVLIGERKEIN